MTVISEIEKLYMERGYRARELRDTGKPVIGYFCCFVPEEIIAAMDMLPYRIQGNQKEPPYHTDAFIEPMSCPFARSCFNLALKGSYDFLDGFVAPHSCDTIDRLYNIWRSNKPSPFNHMINVPHMQGLEAEFFYRQELDYFIKRLEDWSGRKLDMVKLRETVKLYNERRAVLRELYSLRGATPPIVSGTEVTKILVAGMGIPVREHILLVQRYIKEVKRRPNLNTGKKPRIFIWGNEIDDATFIELIEESGAYVVMDDLCTGSRFFWEDVPETTDPLEGIAQRYLCTHCPRSFVSMKDKRQGDLENRYSYIKHFINDWKADGAIFYIIRFCDTCALEGPDLREYLIKMNIPVLIIEDDYSTSTVEQLRTRVQAFLEMLG